MRAFRSSEEQLSLSINGVSVYEDGVPTLIRCGRTLGADPRRNRDVQLRLVLTPGSERIRFWTCDLTAEYMRLNADYTT